MMTDLNEKELSRDYSAVEEDSGIDYKKLLFYAFKYKYWFVASVVVCLLGAFVYLMFATPVYNVTSKVLIKDSDKRKGMSNLDATFQELGFMNNSSGFDNEVEILGTTTLNKKVVASLKLYASYYVKTGLKNVEVYRDNSPYWVDMAESNLDTLVSSVEVGLEENDGKLNVSLKYDGSSIEKVIAVGGEKINTSFGAIEIQRNPFYQGNDDEVSMKAYISPLPAVAAAYAGSLSIEPSSKFTTIAVISMKNNLPKRGQDYLAKLIEIYNAEANIDNNLEASKTADFIDERLGVISKELNMTESELEQYKKNAGIVDYASDAAVNLEQNTKYETQIVEISTQLNLVEYLYEYVIDEKNHLQLIPSNVGLTESGLTAMIAKYNDVVLERNRLLRSSVETSPSVIAATNEAESLLGGIRASLQTTKRSLSIQKQNLQSQQNKFNMKITSSPTKERALADISRQQAVKSGLYLMLLQKREENAITLASAAYKAKVIDEPVVTGMVSPKRNIIMLMALVIGIILPIVVLYVRNFLKYRIEGIDDVKTLSKVPMLGVVPYIDVLDKKDRAVVIEENKNDIMVEVYRNLRSNLPFVLGHDKKVIMFTSCSPGEGKTSIACNLAASIAFAGKKVVVVGLDIRKPRLAHLFGLPNTHDGISNYLAHGVKDFSYLDSLIQGSGISQYLDVLPCGPVAPNPTELLERESLVEAIEFLKSKYDYVILDTAPVGPVSDSLTISRVADLTLFVVRANYTMKSDLDYVNTLFLEHKLPNMNLVLNSAVISENDKAYRRFGSYNYGYGYGYGYGK